MFCVNIYYYGLYFYIQIKKNTILYLVFIIQVDTNKTNYFNKDG